MRFLLPFLFLAIGCAGHVAGNLEIHRGDYAEAVRTLQAVVDENPWLAPARLDLARAHLYLGQFAEAEARLLEAKAARMAFWEADYYLGVSRILQGRTQEGLDYLWDNMVILARYPMKTDIIGDTARLAAQNLPRETFLDRTRRLLLDAEAEQRKREIGGGTGGKT